MEAKVENFEKTETTIEQKPYKFRTLCASDLAPMCKIISKIGINEFTKCFQAESVLKLIANMKGKKSNVNDIAGLQVIMELVQVVMEHIPYCEEDLFALLSSVGGVNVDEIKQFDFGTFTNMIVEFIKKPEFKDFMVAVSKLFK